MLGFRYLKAPPTTHIMLFRNGQLVREGAGISFFHYAPTSTIVQIPVGSTDIPFVFNEVSSDYQDATIQGQLTYRVTSPGHLAALLDFSVDANGRHRTDDPTKLNDRLTHAAQILARAFTQRSELSQLLISSDGLVDHMLGGLRSAEAVANLGVEILDLSVLSIKASPEMAKALQADAREKLLIKADEAVYARRNIAVELERKIKESELNTEIVVAEKKRAVRETQLRTDISIEQERAELVDRKVENDRKVTQARADALRSMLEPMKGVDWRTLVAAQSGGLSSEQLIAMAFRDLADRAESIGNLNISPDLLSTLLSASDSELTHNGSAQSKSERESRKGKR